MFSKVGAFGTFGAFISGGGRNEIRHLIKLIGHQTTPSIQSRQAEIIGRVISLALQGALAIAFGGFLIDPVEAGLQSDEPSIRRLSLWLYVLWYCAVMLVICQYNGRLWQTTSITRRCINFANSLCSDGHIVFVERGANGN
jgi:hypothetical protein